MKKIVLISLVGLYNILSIHTSIFGQAPKWNEPFEIGYTCTGVSIDSKKNRYFTGYSHNASSYTHRFINDTLHIPESISGAKQYWYFYSFIAKLDDKEVVQWIKGIRGTTKEYPVARITCTEIDGEDNIIIAGRYSSSILIDSTLLELPENKGRLFVAKFDTNGSLIWFNSIEQEWGSGYDINDVKVDDENNVYVGGHGLGIHTFYNQKNKVDTIVSGDSERIFFAKYSPSGNFVWCEFLNEGIDQCQLKGMDVDGNGDVYITGWLSGAGSMGDVKIDSPNSDIFVAKYSSNRELKWLKQFGAYYNSRLELGNDIALDKRLNCIYVTGAFSGEIEIDGKKLRAEDENIFLTRISTEGNLIWAKKMGSWSGAASYTEQGTNVMVDEEGFVFVGGTIGQNGNFDGVKISAYDDKSNSNLFFDFFVAKYTVDGKLIWVTHAGHPDHDDVLNDMIKVDNQMYAVGQTRSFAQFDDYNMGGHINYELGFASKLLDNSESILQLSISNLSIKSDTNLIHSLDIICNENWELNCSEKWIAPSVNKGRANCQIILQADTNFTSINREAIITINSESGMEKNIKIKQLKSDIDIGIEDFIPNSIKIYPNPIKDFFFIKTESNIIELSICNIKGQLLYNIKEKINSKIDVSFLKSGIYILIIEGRKFKITKQIIKTP